MRGALRVHLLPLLGIVPAFVLAMYALTEPWARGRLLLVIGISRSPEAALLVLFSLVAMVSATVTVAFRARRLRTAGLVHLLAGVVMVGVTWQAYRMVEATAIRLFGLIPLGSIHPARGLWLFLAAALAVLGLGLVEIGIGALRARRRRARED
jgi:hypothetical protein